LTAGAVAVALGVAVVVGALWQGADVAAGLADPSADAAADGATQLVSAD